MEPTQTVMEPTQTVMEPTLYLTYELFTAQERQIKGVHYE